MQNLTEQNLTDRNPTDNSNTEILNSSVEAAVSPSMARRLPLRALILGSLCATLGLAGCSSKMSKKECEGTDYYQVGVKDGANGRTADDFNKTAGECKAEGVNVPEAKYTYGRQVGLAQYCTPDRATKDARAAKQDSICLKDHVPPYESAYSTALNQLKTEKAKDLQDIQNSKNKLDQRQSKLQNDLQKIDQQQKDAPVN